MQKCRLQAASWVWLAIEKQLLEDAVGLKTMTRARLMPAVVVDGCCDAWQMYDSRLLQKRRRRSWRWGRG